MIRASTSWNLGRVRERIADKVKQLVQDTAEEVWIRIVEGQPGNEYPYWSGSYISSWQVSFGNSVPRSYNEVELSASGLSIPGIYRAPGRDIPAVPSAYTVVNISNAAPHASEVEHDGTPSHPTGWFVAYEAWAHAKMMGRLRRYS